MGFRFRRSIKVLPGIRINLSKSGVGMSAGFKGFRMTKRADGRVQRTMSIPGTGISYVDTHAAGGHFGDDSSSASPASVPQTAPAHKTAACPNCGKRYTIGKSNFCSQCGASLSS